MNDACDYFFKSDIKEWPPTLDSVFFDTLSEHAKVQSKICVWNSFSWCFLRTNYRSGIFVYFISKKIHEGCTRPCFCPMRKLLNIIVIICRMREIFSSMRSLWAWHLVEMRVTRLMRETWQVCSICNAVLGKRDTGFPKWMRESKHNSMHVTDGKRDVSFPKRDVRI